jgi:uncharacterized delta-60 repeat protein
MKQIYTTIASITYIALSFTAKAQDGALDLTFGTNGIVTTAVGTGFDYGRAIALQPDGKILVAGYATVAGNKDFALVRYTANGSLDASFNTNGIATTAIGTGHDYATAIALQADGKIVVAGYTTNALGDNDFAIARYNTNGSLDASFDTDGIVTAAVGNDNDVLFAIAIQTDGKIVVAGSTNNGTNDDFCIARYTTNGSLDVTFNGNGKIIHALGNAHDIVNAIALQTDGKIVVCGQSSNGANIDFAIARYTTTGSADPSFNANGTLLIPIGTSTDVATALAIQPDGKIVITGHSYTGTKNNFAIARCTSNGNLDLSFDTDGITTTAIGTADDFSKAIALQTDGKIVVAGYSFDGAKNDFATVRYTANGSLDPTFDTDGIVTTSILGFDAMSRAIAIQPDSKIVVAGYNDNGTFNNDFTVVRYNNTPLNVNVFEQNSNTTQLIIAPNPSNGSFTIHNLAQGTYNIVNQLGQSIQSFTTTANINTMAIHNLASGIYFITNSTTATHQKIVVTQ